MKFVIHIEGGGTRRGQEAEFRKSWRVFLTKAGIGSAWFRIVRGGSRAETFRSFERSHRKPTPGERPLLLVDSEDPVTEPGSAWAHLRQREEDKNWRKPATARDDDAHLMACCMETWLIADQDALASFFKGGWKSDRIPERHDLETMPRNQVLGALNKASKECQPRYAKGDLSFRILAGIDPTKVEKACPHAKQLFDVLRGGGQAA